MEAIGSTLRIDWGAYVAPQVTPAEVATSRTSISVTPVVSEAQTFANVVPQPIRTQGAPGETPATIVAGYKVIAAAATVHTSSGQHLVGIDNGIPDIALPSTGTSTVKGLLPPGSGSGVDIHA